MLSVRRVTLLAFLGLIGFAGATVHASDPIGVYCVVSRVAMAPNDEHPTTIQIWGACALPTGGMQDNGTYVPGWYTEPRAGYLYYTLPEGQEGLALKEWHDIKGAAGSGDVVAFGARYQRNGRFRWADEKPTGPDPYPIQMGVVRMKAPKGNDVPGYSYSELFAALRKAAALK